MKRTLVTMLLVGLLGAAPTYAEEESPPELKRLRVLYAGDPESPRSERFPTLLRKWVGKVETISLADLDEEKAAGFDVVVADWHRRYDAAGKLLRKRYDRHLPYDFRTPVVMLGSVGAKLASAGKFESL